MSELEKLFEAIGHRPVTMYSENLSTGRVWCVDLQVHDEAIHATSGTPKTAILAALHLVLDHAHAREREGEAFARKARDETARLLRIVAEGK